MLFKIFFDFGDEIFQFVVGDVFGVGFIVDREQINGLRYLINVGNNTRTAAFASVFAGNCEANFIDIAAERSSECGVFF